MTGKKQKINWLLNRWKAMDHPQEDIYRLKQFIQLQFIDRVQSKKDNFKVETKYTFIDNGGQDYNKASFAQLVPEGLDYRQFPLYDYLIEDITQVDQWRKDYKHQVTSPIQFTHHLPAQNFEMVGDFRYVSVLSRLHHFPFLAILSLTENPELVSTLEKQLSDWMAQNPYLKSIHWRSGIEVGIRATNLVYTRKILALSGTANPNLNRYIDQLIHWHFKYLTSHPSLYSSANNHLIAELLGIFVICTHYTFKGKEKWLKKSFDQLVAELFKQTHEDGFTKEQSTHYHVEVLNAYLTMVACAKQCGLAIGNEVRERLEKMAYFLFYLMDDQGHPLQIGDNDEGQLIFPYYDKQFSIYGSISTDMAVMENHPGYLNHYGRFDLRNYLLWGDGGWEKYQSLSKADPQESPVEKGTRLFEKSGYCFFVEDNSRLCFDVGEIGFGELAAHGHSDLLHFTLEVEGEPFIIDPGTFQYHARHEKWRNYFRGATAHNTISINGLDQALAGGRMIWLTKPEIAGLQFSQNEKGIVCQASHNGFVRQGLDVTHQREILYQKDKHSYLVNDQLKGKGEYEIFYMLHFHPKIQIEHLGEEILLTNPKGKAISIQNRYFSGAEIIKGNESIPVGWYSSKFNQKGPTSALYLRVNATGDFSLKTLILV